MKWLRAALLTAALAVISIFSLLPSHVYAVNADSYWVGGSGSWSQAATHWAATDGGGAAAGNLPGATTNVHFTASSSATAYTVTIDGADVCQSMIWALPGTSGVPTLASTGANSLAISGSLTTVTGMIWSSTVATTFNSTTSQTITANGVTFSGAMTFNGAGGTWALQADSSNTFNLGANVLTLTNGTLDLTATTFTVTSGNVANATGTSTLKLGSSAWNCSGSWNLSASTTTLSSNTATITFNGAATQFTGGAKATYNNVVFNGSGAAAILDTGNTFANLTRTGTATTTDTFVVSGSETISTLLTLTGNSVANRLAFKSNTTTARVITSASNTVTNCDFYYISGAGAASWDFHLNAGGAANMGGNIALTLTSTAYWVGGTNNWNSATPGPWSGTSGGTTHPDFNPIATVNATLDANSGAGTATVNSSCSCNTLDMSTSSISNLTISSSILSVLGALTVKSGMTFLESSGNLNFAGSGTQNVTMNGVSITFSSSGGVLTSGTANVVQQDNFTTPTNSYSGISVAASTTWNVNGKVLSTSFLTVSGTLTTGNGTVSLNTSNGSGALLNISQNATLNFGTGSISITNGTQDPLTIGASPITVTGTPNISISGTSGTITGGTGGGALNVTVTGSGTGTYTVTGTGTYNNLSLIGGAGVTGIFAFGGNQTLNGVFSVSGNSQANRLLISSTSQGTARTISATTATSSYADYSDIQAGGAASPFNFVNTQNGDAGANVNITFTSPSNEYWVGNSGSWNDPVHWANSTGGGGGSGHVPLIQDTALFDVNSFAAGGTVTLTASLRISSINTTGVANSPTFSGTSPTFYGTTMILPGVVWSTTTSYFYSRNTTNITAGGTQLQAVIVGNGATNGQLALQGNLVITGALTLSAGTLNLSSYNLTAASFDTSTTTYPRALALGTGTFTLTSTSAITKWNLALSNLTLTPGASTIVLTNSGTNAQTFAGGGGTYASISVGGAGVYTLTITGSSSFTNFIVDRSIAAKTIAFTNGTTTTVTTLGIALAGTTRVALTNTSTNGIWTLSSATGTIYADYLDISYNIATGGAGFYCGTNSTVKDATVTNGSGTMTGSPVSIYEPQSTPTVTAAGTFTALFGSATLHGQAITGGWVVSGNPVTLNPGSTGFTVNAGGSGTITVTATGSGWTQSAPSAPAITTVAATSITGTSAVANSNVTSLGGYGTVSVFFQYSLTGAFAGEQLNTSSQAVAGTGTVALTISGLAANTLYYFRAAINYNSVLYVYASALTFTTTGKPVVATGAAISVTLSTATLQGSIVSVGLYSPDYVYFEYSTTGVFGGEQVATLDQPLTTITGFSANITGLLANQLYYFRAACRYVNVTSQYVYATSSTFTTSTMTVPTVTTLATTDITTTTATIQGNLTSLGTYTTVLVYFEWGPTIAYENGATITQTYTTPGSFSQALTGLTNQTTYHYRAVVKYNGSVVNGSDLTFVTTNPNAAGQPGTNSPDILQIIDTKVFSTYLAPGDQLYVISYKCVYNAGTPSQDPTDYFNLQLFDGSVKKAQVPMPMWNYGVGSIYLVLNSALQWGGSYTITLAGTPTKWIAPPSTSRTLTPGDWIGADLTQLDTWVLNLAQSMTNYSGTGFLTYIAGGTPVLSNTGGVIFVQGIPQLNIVRPNLFYQYLIYPTNPTTPHQQQIFVNTTPQQKMGPYLWSLMQDGALLFGGIQTDAFAGVAVGGLYILLAVVLSFIATPLGGMAIASPVLLAGVWFQVIPIAFLMTVSAIFLALLLKPFWLGREGT